MINPTFNPFWKDLLSKVPAEALAGQDLDSTTFSFLTDVGLPKDNSCLDGALEVNFYIQTGKITRKRYGDTDYYVIGDDLGSSFCLASDGKLFSIDLKGSTKDEVFFVNSSIWQFLECINLFCTSQRMQDSVEYDRNVALKIDAFKKTDPECLNNPVNWWSVIITDPF